MIISLGCTLEPPETFRKLQCLGFIPRGDPDLIGQGVWVFKSPQAILVHTEFENLDKGVNSR